jgi:hypothetical protein
MHNVFNGTAHSPFTKEAKRPAKSRGQGDGARVGLYGMFESNCDGIFSKRFRINADLIPTLMTCLEGRSCAREAKLMLTRFY